MRKLLLATVAALGASMGVATVADAQTTTPAPGTITVRLNGRFRAYGVIVNDRDADNSTAGAVVTTTPGTPTTVGNTTTFTTTTTTVVNPNGPSKQANYGFGTYARLYPGFDGVAANGLRYGVSLEIRQDTGAAAGGGAYGSVSGGSPRRGELYFRREWAYVGTAQLGTVRFGTVDGPSSLFATGTFENFDGGGLNGDMPNWLTQGGFVFPFLAAGNMYSTQKIVYLSPQLFGLDFGIAYEPNTGGYLQTSGCGGGPFPGVTNVSGVGATGVTSTLTNQGASGPGCDRLSSSPNAAENGRRRNLVDLTLRYRGSFSGFGIAATAGYIGSSNVANNGTPAVADANKIEGLSMGDFGAAVTYAGLSVGGHYTFGRYNGGFGLVPKNVDDAQFWLAGASYTVGPLIVGAHYADFQSAGTVAQAAAGRQRRETGLAVGATYSVAPGFSLYASGIYTKRRQNGVAITGITGSGPSTTVSAFGLGSTFSW